MGGKGWAVFPARKTVTHYSTLIVRQGVTVNRIDNQVCRANGFLFWTFVVSLGHWTGPGLVVCITKGAKGGRPCSILHS